MDRNEDNSSDAAKVGNFYNKLMQWIQPKKNQIPNKMGANIQNRRFYETIKKLDLQLCLRRAGIVLEHQ